MVVSEAMGQNSQDIGVGQLPAGLTRPCLVDSVVDLLGLFAQECPDAVAAGVSLAEAALRRR